jgi:hypothetical protein
MVHGLVVHRIALAIDSWICGLDLNKTNGYTTSNLDHLSTNGWPGSVAGEQQQHGAHTAAPLGLIRVEPRAHSNGSFPMRSSPTHFMG